MKTGQTCPALDIGQENERTAEVDLESVHQNETATEQDSWENVEIKVEDDLKNDLMNGFFPIKVKNQVPRVNYPCTECSFLTSTPTYMRRHMKRMHPTVKYYSKEGPILQCEFCDFSSNMADRVKIHTEYKHKITEISQNQQNLRISNVNRKISKDKANMDIKSKRQPRPVLPILQCEFCDFSSRLKNHMKTHTEFEHKNRGSFMDTNMNGGSEQFKQEYLKDEKKDDGEQGTKQTSKKNESEKSFLCEQCAKSYTSNSSLRAHVEIVHKKKKYHCDKCDYSCYGHRAFGHHKWKEHNRAQKSFICDQCDYVTDWKSELKIHIEVKHLGKTYPCTICDFVANSTQTLGKHVKRVHQNIKYPCDACDKVFNTTAALRNHEESMHQNLRLPCPQCGHIFKTKEMLKKHIRIKHVGPIRNCDVCDFSTRTKKDLKAHKLLIHN